eukprot:CAMPEP_0119388550 /NCGR_PEP_ID=MMETSP1334-20130426/105422_1 /TAXON_ID=127549 /ORGANISM="Calcidiscus leptoporus, Strain RCC1130" /LENGTH=109 /DNA_ID=CAMNT_0007410567 /DNA_START=462 /DNA_END=788 /DNA_ORIENTATION=-
MAEEKPERVGLAMRRREMDRAHPLAARCMHVGAADGDHILELVCCPDGGDVEDRCPTLGAPGRVELRAVLHAQSDALPLRRARSALLVRCTCRSEQRREALSIHCIDCT